MSYERRLEIEALPAEEGWARWVGVVGHGTTLVERKRLAPVTIWIVGAAGPTPVEAYQYENWRFAENGRPADKRWLTYTQWHSNTEYTDYSPRAEELKRLCAETREALCARALTILNAQIEPHTKELARLESARSQFC